MEVVYCESFGPIRSSYSKIQTLNLPVYMSDIKGTLLQYSSYRIGTTNRSETSTVNYFH